MPERVLSGVSLLLATRLAVSDGFALRTWCSAYVVACDISNGVHFLMHSLWFAYKTCSRCLFCWQLMLCLFRQHSVLLHATPQMTQRPYITAATIATCRTTVESFAAVLAALPSLRQLELLHVLLPGLGPFEGDYQELHPAEYDDFGWHAISNCQACNPTGPDRSTNGAAHHEDNFRAIQGGHSDLPVSHAVVSEREQPRSPQPGVAMDGAGIHGQDAVVKEEASAAEPSTSAPSLEVSSMEESDSLVSDACAAFSELSDISANAASADDEDDAQLAEWPCGNTAVSACHESDPCSQQHLGSQRMGVPAPSAAAAADVSESPGTTGCSLNRSQSRNAAQAVSTAHISCAAASVPAVGPIQDNPGPQGHSCDYYCSNYADSRVLTELKGKQLRVLKLTQVWPDFAQDLQSVAGLTCLHLLDGAVADCDVRVVAKEITGLLDLSLARCKHVTDEALKYVACNLTQLTALNLNRTSVTDAGVAGLSRLVDLQELSVRRTQDQVSKLAKRAAYGAATLSPNDNS